MQATALIVTRYGIIMRLVFFFSSRRRHTRFDCDWSSDVCSSDLLPMPVLPTWVTRHKSRDLHLVPTVTIDAIAVTPLGRSLLDLGAVEPGRLGAAIEIGRASCRERVEVVGAAVAGKKKYRTWWGS